MRLLSVLFRAMCVVALATGLWAVSPTLAKAASAPADSHASGQSSGTSSKSRECPVVKTADDGSIKWVISC